MNRSTLTYRSLRFYWRTHLTTALGAALATAVLVGALAAGDSVRGSLRQLVLNRLGSVEFALATGDRFFQSTLADRVARPRPARSRL